MNRREEEPPWPLPKNWNDRLGGYYPSEEDERREMEEQEEYLRSGYLNDPEHKFKILSHWVGPEIDYPRHFTAEHWDPYENDVLLVRPEPPPPEPPFKRYIVLGLVVWWLFHRFLDWRHRKKMAYRRERDERMAHGIPWWDKRDFKVAYTDVLQNMRARENRWRIRHGYLPLWEDENGDTYELFEWDNYGRPYPPDPTPEEIAREKKRVARLEKRRAWKQKLKDTGEACIFPGALEDLSDPEDFTPGFDDNPEYFELEEEQGRSSDQKVEVVKERETTPQPPGAFPREEPRYLTYHQSYPPYQPPSFYGEPVTVAAVPPAAQPGSKPTPHEKQQENSKQVQAPRVQVQPKSTSSIATRRPATHNDDGEVLPRPPKRRKTTQATDTPRDDHMLIDNEVQDQEYSMEICDPESRGVKRSREDDQEPGSVEGSRKRIKKDTSELPVTSQAKTKAVPSKKRVKNKTTAVAEVQHPLPDPNEPMLAKDGVVSTDPICEGRWIGDVWLGTRWIFRVGMLGRRERLGEMICQSRLPGVFGHMPEKERIQCWVSEQEYAEAKVLGTMDSPTHFCHITVPVEEINEYCWARAAKILRPHPTRFLKKLEPPPPRPKTPPPVIEPPRPVDPLAGILESLPATPNQGTRVFVTLPSARTVASMAREPGLYPTPDLHTSKSPSRIPHIPKAELPRTKSSAKSISSSSRQRDKSKPKERSKPRREPIVIDDDDIDVTDSVVIPPTKEQAFVQTEPAISMRPTDNSAPLVNEHASQPIPTAPIVIVEMATQTYTSESPATLPSTSPTEETSQAVSTGDIALRTAPRPKSMSKRARLERISTQISSVPSKLSPSEAMNEARRKLANKPARPSPLSQVCNRLVLCFI
ncbi:hypothetical protein FRC14_003967 [Serendipita sp. 396]|nr:hypothetical protein FRC14_003967 [Serendipita sp. 396]